MMPETCSLLNVLRGLAACFCALALATPPVRGADTPVASDPVFTALLVDGKTLSGRIRQFGEKGDVTLVPTEGPEQVIAAESLVKLSRDALSLSLTPEPSGVLFPDGDRLYRTAIGAATETTLEVQSYSLDGKLAVPLDSLLGLIFAQPNDSEALDAQVIRLRDEPRTSEVLWLANGDRVKGGFLGLTDKAVEFQSGKTDLKLDRSGVIALGFDPKLVVYPKPAGVFFELTFTDGSRLGVTGARLESGHVAATTRFGAAIKVRISELTRVHPRSASVAYLSERATAAANYEPYVGPPRPYRRDATVDGHPFRLSSQEFDRGIGTESRTILAYRLEPGDKRFQAFVGLDERAGPLGSVVFRVLVDRAERFLSPAMTIRDAPRVIDLDISGAKSLILITEFGERGGVRDLADWVEARIIR